MAEKMEFQSEAKQVLELMINSVYSNPDIFVRELISNASDAIDKLRIESLSRTELAEYAKNGRIDITIDKKAGTLTFSDNGIGMDRDELVSYLGTIARSGTGEFIRAMQEAKNGINSDLIGQFGVGFYSSFIAADKVTVETLKAGGSESWKWESTGDGTYTIDRGSRTTQGSAITLHMKKEEKKDDEHDIAKDYLSEWTLRGIIKEYSDFVTYPIYLNDTEKEKKDNEKEEPVNSMKALWTRPQKEISDEEFNDFYRHISHDWENPLEHIYYKAEGTSEFRALLFIPSRPPMDLFYQDGKHGVQLYIRRVFIMNDCKDLIPEYMRFIKGVVDSEDLSLNVSREMLQQDRQLTLIRTALEKRIRHELTDMLEKSREDYEKFWNTFGLTIKFGIYQSYGANRGQLEDLLLFRRASDGKLVTLKEYADAMPEGQKYCYYAAGESFDKLSKLPQAELLRDKGYDLLCLTDTVDEFLFQILHSYNEKEFRSVSSGDLGLESDEQKAEQEKLETEYKELFDFMKESLGDRVSEVCLSTRLKSHPVCLTAKGAVSLEMEKVLNTMPGNEQKVKAQRVLELNPDSGAFAALRDAVETDPDKAKQYAELLYHQALLIAGLPLEDPAGYTELVCALMK